MISAWQPSGFTCTQSAITIVIQEAYGSASTSPLCLKQQSGPVTLNPGASAIIYYKMPSGLFNPTDSGLTSEVSILTGNVPIIQIVRIANP